jgi:DNA-binding response OmpR family regulator
MDILSKLLSVRRRSAACSGSALIALSDPLARRSLKQALGATVSGSLLEADSKQSFHRAVTFNEIDLIIADSEIKGWSSAHSIEQIRFGRMHAHAFPIIVILTDDRATVFNCGADLVLPKNEPAPSLVGQLTSLRHNRKPFVVAPRYIGPERRVGERLARSTAATLTVPNPLLVGTSGVSQADYRRQLQLATHSITQIRRGFNSLRRHGPQPPPGSGG